MRRSPSSIGTVASPPCRLVASLLKSSTIPAARLNPQIATPAVMIESTRPTMNIHLPAVVIPLRRLTG